MAPHVAVPTTLSHESRPSLGMSEGDSSQATAPLRRKSSMGSFQKGMGESLTGRMRKQLDIPRGPKPEIDTNIPIDQIQSLSYLAQVIPWPRGERGWDRGYAQSKHDLHMSA